MNILNADKEPINPVGFNAPFDPISFCLEYMFDVIFSVYLMQVHIICLFYAIVMLSIYSINTKLLCFYG